MEKIRVFLDTNVVIDYLTGRKNDGIAERIIQVGQDPQYELCISFLTAVNTLYISKKYTSAFGPEILSELFTILPHNNGEWERSSRLHWDDFEDAVQFICAIDSKCDLIITNDKHFCKAPMAVFSPEEFLTYID